MKKAEAEFFKRRRNLIAGSLLVGFVNIADTEITRLNIFGNVFEISNSKIIPISFCIMLVYFLIRYFQYAHDVKNKGFKKRYQKSVDSTIGPYLLKREFQNPNSAASEVFGQFSDVNIETATLFDPRYGENVAIVSVVRVGGGTIETFHLIVTKWDRAWLFIIASMYITFRTRLATDYILPVILAALAFGTYAESMRTFISNLF